MSPNSTVLAPRLPTIVAKLRVPLVFREEAAGEVVVGMQHWPGNEACALVRYGVSPNAQNGRVSRKFAQQPTAQTLNRAGQQNNYLILAVLPSLQQNQQHQHGSRNHEQWGPELMLSGVRIPGKLNVEVRAGGER